MSSNPTSLDFPFRRLRDVRTKLLRLHKALLESEKVEYEKFNGPIRSRGEFFQLVIGDGMFSWLRPFSQLIAQIDEVMAAKDEPVTLQQVNHLLEETQILLRPSENGNVREKRYFEAIQRDPDIAFMHAELSQLLSQKS
ncbi:MAG: hypothetical protein WAN66_11130 [Limnoraphis robusta]|jgi:hypothetical protein|uniref:Uncharacterized protein n=2 Tax=Limnoraphis robusta TaxID=1118279 RepID=A0A0F5Y9J4_9CYAN|nr:hypothetical protein [Limnoraphis robusta]MCG5057121.1 hypothetical protein [Limnoraphis sp. WC205]KKD34890.1 hypothetical protein WN50_28360 [Limnoraphis robusta CS-951]MEA5498980.1 hypothetical protein [Limnoraphis robusta BA-68 BA1]MEA5518971.1 hypothetical protein [Limnoraphis robusta CCNP1315]MEA5539417.1 hypothetical protein [Limnoraphis robusta Tam1]